MRSGFFRVRTEQQAVTIRTEKCNRSVTLCNRSVTFSHRAVTAESQGDNKKVTATPATGVLNGVVVTIR